MKTVDAVYLFSLTQTDAAGNISSPLAFSWERDTSIPPTPTITSFLDNPHYTNTSPLTVQGACVSGNTVTITESGTVLASGACTSGAYSLNVAKGSNGTYMLSVYQTDAVSLNDSSMKDFTWIYDSVAPAAPIIKNPTTSPVTSSGNLLISGLCENNDTVFVNGDDAQSVVCSGGLFSFTVSKPADGTYNFSVTQKDLAGNTSAAATQQWIRDSSSLPIPTIDSPSMNPYISNSVQLILSGTCQSGLTVVLGGIASSDVVSPAGSLNFTCVNSAYSYKISKPDGTYALTVYQTDGIKNSASVSLAWTKDTVEPNTTLSSTPSNPNYSITNEFVFSANESPVTFLCSLDGGAYSPCVSPLVLTGLSNTSHTISIKAIDQANNVESTPATYTWTQNANTTVALYHFDAVAPLLDSSNFSGGASNTLTDNASSSVVGKFAEGRTAATTANYLTVNDTPSQQTIARYLTLESQVKLTTLPSGYAPIVSKVNTSISKASFEYGFRKQGSKYYLYFRGSTNGTSYTEVRSASLTTTEISALTAGFNHAAVTFNAGAIKFYFNGVAKGTGTVGTVGSAKLASSTAALRIGYNGAASLAGTVDEVRISQSVRWNSAFTAPSAAYTAD